ncbi:LLM class flavin-dependent oxidoreductase [Planctomyces sp. SH-PL62]|uniref:LLM class flavin-dependent oxidoreductase n=1 Tax=Planctomyces sp. SH-PL62 TaxID=1636152 RepID=UPI00078D9809|nr:LLM class flavin-dependent oxidoreductase [Planctomyces sp. SH-PL62]AMV37748.1 Limonene 1,2-monooxygenase [Planctomyces sp. SH-PL62]
MKQLDDVKISVLDLCPIVEGGTAADAFRDSLDLVRHAERLGYERYWVAEHHNIPGVASAATSVVIGQLAAATSRIRVGAGGIMLPNHAPLVIAEQFGTLASLFPGRIDLGLGRAPGGDQATAKALRRYFQEVDSFPVDVRELQGYFRPAKPGRLVRAIPGEGLDVPIWLLGSSDFGARLAADMGLPYAFASHFAPDHLFDSLAIYRESFVPSETLDRPHAMIGVNAFVADTDEAAARLFTSHQQMILHLVRGRPGLLPPPVDDLERLWTPPERAAVERMTRVTVVGAPETVRARLQSLVNAAQPDEMIFSGHIYDHAARLRSYELLMQACRTTPVAAG